MTVLSLGAKNGLNSFYLYLETVDYPGQNTCESGLGGGFKGIQKMRWRLLFLNCYLSAKSAWFFADYALTLTKFSDNERKSETSFTFSNEDMK